MRIGVYVDGYNVYYAARRSCGRGTPGWRWLDIRGLAQTLVGEQPHWAGGQVDRVVYCTARISAKTNAGGAADQETYLRALKRSGSVGHIEFGNYVSRVKHAPLAVKDAKGRPQVVTSNWPLMIHAPMGSKVEDANFLVSYLHNEEKGSDVNVASHLLVDVLDGAVDAAVVISNDSDLRWPTEQVRQRVPLGTVNPGGGYTALSGDPLTGPGGHWWRSLRADDYKVHQLPDPAGGVGRPSDW